MRSLGSYRFLGEFTKLLYRVDILLSSVLSLLETEEKLSVVRFFPTEKYLSYEKRILLHPLKKDKLTP